MLTVLVDLSMLAIPSTRSRGMGRYAIDLSLALAARSRQRHDGSRIIVLEHLSHAGAATISDDVEAAVARLAGTRADMSQADWAYRVRLWLGAAARRAGADVVHSLDPDATPLGAPGCPRVVTCHDLIVFEFPQQYWSWRDGGSTGRCWLDRRRFARADHIIAVSQTTADALVKVFNIPASKITVVRHGVDSERFTPIEDAGDRAVRDRHGVAGRPYLLYVGGADWRKNVDGMFAAMTAIRERGGDLALLWAGRLDAKDLAVVRTLSAERQLDDTVLRLLGWVPDVDLVGLMRGATALLFVSRAEGFGYPIVEAMASGCPVIAGKSAGVIEIAGDAALLVDPDNVDDIVDAALRLTRESGTRRSFVERGLVRSRTFTLARMADETHAVYAQVAAAP